MQSTGQTSMQASQPVQLSARMTASSFGSFLRGLAAAGLAGAAGAAMNAPGNVGPITLYSIGSRRFGEAFLRRRVLGENRFRRVDGQPEDHRHRVHRREAVEVPLV